MTPEKPWPLVIVGAGAAGLMAGVWAGRCRIPTLMLEASTRIGAKIRISGGGRCNVLPSRMQLEQFHTQGSKNTLRNIFGSWPLEAVQAFFQQELKIPLKIEATGKMFPQSDRAQDVIDALLQACASPAVRLQTGVRVQSVHQVETEQQNRLFELRLKDGTLLFARRVLITTGGLSVPKTGSDGAGLVWAKKMGHQLCPTSAALVPLHHDEADLHALRGLSVPATLRAQIGNRVLASYQGEMLFTHRGYSGPVVLNISHWFTQAHARQTAVPRIVAHFGCEPLGFWRELLRTQPQNMRLGTCLNRYLPRRLVETLLIRLQIDAEQLLGDLSKKVRQRLVVGLEQFDLQVRTDEGFKTAEVTAGGVTLDEIYAKTMESKVCAGLHFAGEVLDVTGDLGGYNFLWAWISARRAIQGVVRLSTKLDE